MISNQVTFRSFTKTGCCSQFDSSIDNRHGGMDNRHGGSDHRHSGSDNRCNVSDNRQNGVPLTGDPQVDANILAFQRARQTLLKQG